MKYDLVYYLVTGRDGLPKSWHHRSCVFVVAHNGLDLYLGVHER